MERIFISIGCYVIFIVGLFLLFLWRRKRPKDFKYEGDPPPTHYDCRGNVIIPEVPDYVEYIAKQDDWAFKEKDER